MTRATIHINPKLKKNYHKIQYYECNRKPLEPPTLLAKKRTNNINDIKQAPNLFHISIPCL